MTGLLHFTLISPLLLGMPLLRQQQNEIKASLQSGSEVPKKTMGYGTSPEGDGDVSLGL